MKMMQVISLVGMTLCFSPIHSSWAQGEEEGAKVDASTEREAPRQEDNKWGTAGHEVKQATSAVVEATRETAGSAWDSLRSGSSEVWHKTKDGSIELYDTVGEKSKQAWHATKEESQELWHKGKAVLHDATAPERPVTKAPQAPPQPEAPATPVQPETPQAASPQ